LTAVGLITDVPVKIQGKTFSGPVQQRCWGLDSSQARCPPIQTDCSA
jgi:hypothetical protein